LFNRWGWGDKKTIKRKYSRASIRTHIKIEHNRIGNNLRSRQATNVMSRGQPKKPQISKIPQPVSTNNNSSENSPQHLLRLIFTVDVSVDSLP
jgi:hypothetical protein